MADENKKESGVIVLRPFRSKYDWNKAYEVGDKFDDTDEKRIKELIKLKLIGKVDEEVKEVLADAGKDAGVTPEPVLPVVPVVEPTPDEFVLPVVEPAPTEAKPAKK